jgi:hypothetical protein
MDNDEAGHTAAEKFARQVSPDRSSRSEGNRKLGIRRCLIVRPLANVEVHITSPPPPLKLSSHLGDQNTPKDANDALRHPSINGEDLILQMLARVSVLLSHPPVLSSSEIFLQAERISHNNLSKFADLRAEVISHILNGSKKGFSGTPTPSLPKVTSITKGFRDGELVIFTGPTGRNS